MSQNNYYVKIDGITGKATDPDHPGWIDVIAWSIPQSQSANPVNSFTNGMITLLFNISDPVAYKLSNLQDRVIPRIQLDLVVKPEKGITVKYGFYNITLGGSYVGADFFAIHFEFESGKVLQVSTVIPPLPPKYLALINEQKHSNHKLSNK